MPRSDNPYAAPSSAVVGALSGSGRVWRAGKLLHMDKGAALPPRCVRCNEPAETVLERKLYWHSPWWALLIFAGLLTYAIVALVVRRRADVGVGLCSKHARARRTMLTLAWASALGGTGACAALPESVVGFNFVLGLAGVVGALLLGQRHASVLRPVRIDEREVRLTGASEPFLASLERDAA